MTYSAYDAHDTTKGMLRAHFQAVAAVFTATSTALRMVAPFTAFPRAYEKLAKKFDASVVMGDRMTKDYAKPSFRMDDTTIDGKKVAVREETVAEKPFGKVTRFRRDTDRKDPKVLIVAPMSGHFATLLRDTVEALLPSHDVHIVEWANARDVPLSAGKFGFDEYNAYVQDFLRAMGPDTHVMAVCQPTVPVLSAVSVMAKHDDPCQPLSMTLMAGPIDTRVNETGVNKTATEKPMSWFRDLTHEVPEKYAGAGRKVYPGFIQLMSFMAMNWNRHIDSHREMYNDLSNGDHDKARKKIDFYDEYFATEDMTAEFYLETVSKVFQKYELARGVLDWRGERVDPGAIRKTALFTVEGGEDDICGRGQTEAAQILCAGLKPEQKYHYVQPGAGHYGVFNGRRWQNEIAPRFARFIRDIAERNNVAYTQAASESKVNQGPDRWDAKTMVPELRVLHGNNASNRQQKQAAGPTALIA